MHVWCLFFCVQFFKKRGVAGVKDEYNLFNQVTGLELCGQGEEFLAQVIELLMYYTDMNREAFILLSDLSFIELFCSKYLDGPVKYQN